MKKKIILVGGGGHCKSCIDVIESEGKYEISGIIDIKENLHKTVFGYKVIGTDDDLPELIKEYDNFFITIGQIKSADKRISLYKKFFENKKKMPVIISPHARACRDVSIGVGSIVMHNAVVNSDSKIGVNSIINTAAVIEHDCTIGNHCHVSTGSFVNGGCLVGKECFIGSGAVLINNISLCENVVIGAGSVVVKSISQPGIYAGNPARRFDA